MASSSSSSSGSPVSSSSSSYSSSSSNSLSSGSSISRSLSSSSSSSSSHTLSSSSSSQSTGTSSSSSSGSTVSSSSSQSTNSTSSSVSDSSSSSSVSSESSIWDTEWFSMVYCPLPETGYATVKATVELDIRHSDATMVQWYGSALIGFGGTIGKKAIQDGFRATRTFADFTSARQWQAQITNDIRELLTTIREFYLEDNRQSYDNRHRRL